MVYVVERYLPGLSRSDLLRGLSRLEQTADRDGSQEVRYLGSTIVLGDEACFCQFEGPSEEAVADANTRAGLSFDRIVPAVTVGTTKGVVQMSVSASVPATIHMRRSRLVGLLAAVAAVAAAITWAVQTFAVNTGSEIAAKSQIPAAEQSAAFNHFATGINKLARAQQKAAAEAAAFKQFANGVSKVARAQQNAAALHALGLDAQSISGVRSVMNLTPADLAGGGLRGYALPSSQSGPTLEETLASMSPEARRYVTTLMSLTFRQLAEGAAGHP
jgi:uncharacterized protein DUF4242